MIFCSTSFIIHNCC